MTAEALCGERRDGGVCREVSGMQIQETFAYSMGESLFHKAAVGCDTGRLQRTNVGRRRQAESRERSETSRSPPHLKSQISKPPNAAPRHHVHGTQMTRTTVIAV